MNIAVLGTGMVGRAHATRLVELGHDVVVGTQDVEKTQAKAEPALSDLKLQSFVDAANHGEIVINALAGSVAVEVLKGIQGSLENKLLIDISNPLDFSKGMPPTLFVSNTDSLGEQIQRALPNTKVVKTLNTTSANIQVNPKSLAGGDHHVFVSGDDKEAKARVVELLNSYGWDQVLDLGDITTARGTEMFLPLWLRVWSSLNDVGFNIKVVRNG